MADLPNALLKLGLALAKHHAKNVIGDEALEVVATTLTDVGGEKVQAKVDSIFASKEGQRELLKAAKAADEKFKQECKDNDLRQLFTMDYGSLPSVQEAIGKLPEALDDEILRETLFTAFRNDAPRRISDEKINEGVNLYVECLQSALIPVKDFGLRIIHNALKEIGRDVKDVKADVKTLLEKAITGAQSAADSKNYARFLVPFPHNPDFVGREVELASLHEMLQKKESIVGIRPTVLVGLGGIGKTQLAAEYAHAHRDDYPSGVFWLNAINPLLFEFSDLAEKLEMSDRDTPRDKAARKVWDYLDAHPDALVIFDNVLEPSQLNIPFSPGLVPANLRCRTLFTTRQRDFPRTFQPFEVKTLPEMAAMKLLLRSRPEVLEEHHPEWGWARIVCAELGWLPLALELASAYLGAYPEVSITGYLERLRTEGSLETVDESEVRAVDLPTRVEEILKAAAAGNLEVKHQVAVSATLQTQWKRLDDEDAKLLFRAAGQFSEASWIPTPRLGLLTGIGSEAKAGRPSPLSAVLKKLHAVSLIEELSEDRLRLHPLVQEFAESLSSELFRMEMAERVAAEFDDLLRVQARVLRYGVDIVIEDLRTALGFCIEQKDTETYSRISKMEHVLDRQAHLLRGWNVQELPVFFFQQIRNEFFSQHLSGWQTQAETELSRTSSPYLSDRFPVYSGSADLRTFAGHNDRVGSVALDTSGKIAVSASDDHTFKVWDVTTGRELRAISMRLLARDVALSADGRLAITDGMSGEFTVWDIPTGRELRTIKRRDTYHTKVKFVSDVAKPYLALTVSDKKICLWNSSSGRIIRTFYADQQARQTAVSADGNMAVSVSDDHVFRVWEIKLGRLLYTFTGTGRLPNGVAVSKDGSLVVTNFWETIKVWNAETGHELYAFKSRGKFTCITLSLDGLLAVAASSDNTIKVWELLTGRELHLLSGHSGTINSLALSTDRQLLVSAASDRTVKVWNISTLPDSPASVGGQTDKALEQHARVMHSGPVNGVALSADGCLAISVSDDQTVKVWDTRTGYELRTFTSHGARIYSVALSANGKLAISASEDTHLKVWDIVTGLEVRTITGVYQVTRGIVLSADAKLAALLSCNYEQYTVSLYEVETGKRIREFVYNTRDIKGMVTNSNERLSIFSYKGKIWNATTWKDIPEWHELCIFREYRDAVNSVALNANQQLAVVTSADQTLKVWQVGADYCITALQIGASINCCAMSADGKMIVAGDGRGGVHFLDLMNADELLAKDVKIEKSWLALKKESGVGS